jgi:hypothetical protein
MRANNRARRMIRWEATMNKLLVSTMLLSAVALGGAVAGPLPDAKLDDVGFSQAGLARMDDFFAREIAAKRVPGAVVAIARDGKLVHYKAYGQLDPAKGTAMPLDAVFALPIASGCRISCTARWSLTHRRSIPSRAFSLNAGGARRDGGRPRVGP